MMKYITNGISPKMFTKKTPHLLKLKTITPQEFNKNKKDAISTIGHHKLAEQLGIPRNRFNIQAEKGDIIYIVQGADGRSHSMDTPNYNTLQYQKLEIYY